MTIYELMIKTNHYLMNGGELTEPQKSKIVRQLLSGRSTPDQASRFYRGVRNPGNTDGMYPIFYIPPYNDGKKFQTVIPMSPNTHILSANAYELEIIRLLHLFEPQNVDVQTMVNKTLARLKITCFGYKNCAVGECFHTALIVIRFLATVAPHEKKWLQKQITLYHNHVADTRRHSGVKGYFELCLSELPKDVFIHHTRMESL